MLPDFIDDEFKDWLVTTLSARSVQDLYEMYLNDKVHRGERISDAEIEKFTAYVQAHGIDDLIDKKG